MRALAASGVVLLFAALSGCGAKVDPARAQVEDAVRRYNAAVSEAHLRGSFETLERAATETEATRVELIVTAIREKGEVLQASVEELKVEGVSVTSETATARTRETWSYERVDQKTRAAVAPKQRREYAMAYQLVRKDASWLVDRVTFESPSRSAEPGR